MQFQTVPRTDRPRDQVSEKMSKGFHEKLLKFAQSIGMGGLGYLEVLEDGSYKGPIDKFIRKR